MPVPANTQQTFQTRGNRESLADVIYNISPTETPIMSNIGRGTAEATLDEWQTDALAAPDVNNAQIQGDDATTLAFSPTTRVANATQISTKTIRVSGTQEAVRKAGRKSELAYQRAKRSKELKRDMEQIMFGANTAATLGNASTAARLGSILSWLRTNVSLGVGGANPAAANPLPAGTRTDGTQRVFTETLLKDVLQQCYTNGGDPSMVVVGAFNKGVASTFAGVATKTFYQSAVKETAIIGAADVYVGDFHTVSFVPDRFIRPRDALVLDPSMASVAFLREFGFQDLAKTGDSTQQMLLAEYTLRVNNEAAHGLIADLTVAV